MTQAKNGDTVKVHYTGTLNDGTQFDSSVGREPLEVTLGTGQVIAGFETAIVGMAAGDKQTVVIPCAEAYGAHSDQLVQEIGREALPGDIPLEVGLPLQVTGAGGQTFRVTVTAFSDSTVTLDGNHPLAGQDLTFDLELVEIV